MISYDDYISQKLKAHPNTGFDVAREYDLYPFQSTILERACVSGRYCIFADCGLGKTRIEIAFAESALQECGGKALILTPLAVAHQFVTEGDALDVPVAHVKFPTDDRIQVTNYQKLDHFDPSEYSVFILDESSILKSFTGSIRNAIQAFAENARFRLAGTATPSPNDWMELGTHSEFVGAMTRGEMLATYFINDQQETQQWRLKGHAQEEFWRWVASWSVAARCPADIGFPDDAFALPPLHVTHHVIEGNPIDGELFPRPAQTLSERRAARRESMGDRVKMAAGIANSIDDQVVVWCDLNDESAALSKAIQSAVEITGSDSEDHKESSMIGFADGSVRCLVTKPRIAGWGMNWQNCNRIIFAGLSDSFEAYYQAVRRCWRFGQKRPVYVDIITSSAEGAVMENIQRKEQQHEQMLSDLCKHLHDAQENPLSVRTESGGITLPMWIGERHETVAAG